jgi:hypothetical protein
LRCVRGSAPGIRGAIALLAFHQNATLDVLEFIGVSSNKRRSLDLALDAICIDDQEIFQRNQLHPSRPSAAPARRSPDEAAHSMQSACFSFHLLV